MNLEFNLCHGVKEIASNSTDRNCFVIIMESKLWCLIVSIAPCQKEPSEIEQLKLRSINMERPS